MWNYNRLVIDKRFFEGCWKVGGQSINTICKHNSSSFQSLLSALVFMIKEDVDVRIITNNFSLITVHVYSKWSTPDPTIESETNTSKNKEQSQEWSVSLWEITDAAIITG